MKRTLLKVVSALFVLIGGGGGILGLQASENQSISTQNPRTGKITGTVVDNAGQPVPGANVIVEGTTTGTTTGVDGTFELSGVAPDATLEISFIGYATQSVPVNNRTGFDITLLPDAQQVEEVVVTAYGQVKQAKSVGYATTRVSTTEIERANAVNPITALQGKVAGVQINAGGASGITSSSAITIRGAKSIDKNNSPIFVVDGMIIQEPLTGNLAGTDWGSQLKNLNPADYESVTVLKGAAATALYGSRGANGAVVIVSKGGKMGKQGLGVEINQTLEWTDVYKSPVDMQDTYGPGIFADQTIGSFLPDGTLSPYSSYSWGPAMDGRMINQRMPHGRETPFVPHPDNWKELFQTGLNSTTNVAISGGTEKSSFRFSYGYMDNTGVFRRNEFSRHNVSFRGTTELNKVFSVEMGVQYAFSKALNGASQGGWDWDNNAGMIATYYMARNMDIADFHASYRDPETGSLQTAYPMNSRLAGYLWNRDMNTNQRFENSMLADLTLRARLTDWLNASTKVNYNYYGYNSLSKGYPTDLSNATGYSYSRGGETSGSYNVLGMLQTSNINLDKNGDFTLGAILAAELYGNTAKNSWSKGTNGGFNVPNVFAFSNSVNAIVPTFSYTPRNEQTFGLFGIVNLAWKDQLFLELTARNDWLSTLTYPTYITAGQNNYSVFYPSANASWVFTDTFRDAMPDWFSFGKLRASISRVGMGTAAYNTANGFGVYNQTPLYLPDGSTVNSANPNLGTSFNNDLKPEVQQSIELGADLRFFDERLNIDLAYYKTNTFHQIMSVGSVAESGANTKLINAGNIQNQGIELQLEATPIRNKDWRWTVGGNFTLNRGKIKELDPEVKEWCLMGAYDAAPEIWAYEGGAFGVLTTSQNSRYNSPAVVDPKTGKFMLMGGDVYSGYAVYDAYTRYDRNEAGDRDRIVLGKVEPNFTISLNTSLSWKNLDLYMQADGRVGGKYFSNMWKYASTNGNLKSSMEGRDKAHGGIPRIGLDGQTHDDGLMLDAVFVEGAQAPTQNPDGSAGPMVDVGGLTYAEAIAQKNIMPTTTAMWYYGNYGWGGVYVPQMPNALQDNTWLCLREITLGYRLPERICKKFGANYLRLGFTIRNVCYLVNRLTDGLNPASISSNNPLQPMDIGAVPFYRTYAFNLTVRF